MTDDSSHGVSRRRVLATATAAATAAGAGCVGALGGDSSGPTEIEPVEPSQPRKGTPGEFYTLVERNDLTVESLQQDGSDLLLQYVSNAESESESRTEIEIIATVYNENLVKNDTEIDMLTAEITNPFDGQAHGWGVKTQWCEQYNEAVANSQSNSSTETTNGTENGTANETESQSAAGMAAITLMNNILNSRVYEEDLEG